MKRTIQGHIKVPSATEVDSMLLEVVIQPAATKSAISAVLSPKKDGSLRL